MATGRMAIVTGASRGLGLAIVRQLLTRGDTHVLAIARRPVPELAIANIEQWAVDLAEPVSAAQRLADRLSAERPDRFERASLINNAGVLPTLAPLNDIGLHELSSALRVGLEAALLLTAAFLGATEAWRADRRVLNVSSGLGRRAMAGQATYCAAKAGMDHFSRAVSLEGARIVSLSPGVIDTDMQEQIRAADPQAFPERWRFVQMKERGDLVSPEVAATRVLAYLERPDFGTESVADVRDAP